MAVRRSSFVLRATPVTIIAHLMGIAAVTLVLIWYLHFREGLAFKSSNKLKIFNVHPVLMVVGFVVVAGEGVMAYKTIPGTRKVQKFFHMTFHLIALLVGILGVYAVFKFKREVGQPDMFTFHSWLGMGTICLFGLQWLVGFFSYWFPGAEMPFRASFLPWHAFFGMAIFLMTICTAEMGLVEKFLSQGLGRDKEAYVVNFTGVAILLFGITVTLSSVLPRY
ncbi:probable ascorbate-specific transmembrane electron transporter 1 [Magnolia sinica]|uniref:probable ascorbate-specific transmembrane electron transporter 1 n=1 Tax=Magnolia sinica TaxID=86752 RepID=UPI00265B6BEB|nr:probable ascorbate-specific transmembrane electron transporter 1 [Magnolia sinica]